MSKDRNKRLDNLFGGVSPAPASGGTTPPQRPRVGAGAVGAAELNLLKDENTRLKAALEGAEIADLNLSDIDPSPYPDRLDGTEESEGYAQLKASLAARGQEVPILVRPHPNAKGRYQTVFGHRRVRGLVELGHAKVRAAIRALSDEDLLIAQGVENSARQDLSWIEKALFARKLEAFAMANGKDATQMVLDALSIHAPEASRYRTTIEAVGDKLILAIGSAPKVGRTKWMALAEALKADKKAPARLLRLTESAAFRQNPSDTRFVMALSAVLPEKDKPAPTEISSPSGTVIARVEERARATRLDFEDKDFARFVQDRLRRLHSEFRDKHGK